MVKVDVVAKKLARAKAWLDDSEEVFILPPEDFLVRDRERDLALFYLFLAIQECIDLAAHWVSDAGWDVPDDAASTFDLLAANGALEDDLAAALRGAVGLRNRIAHGYASIDAARVQNEFRPGAEALRRFLVLAGAEAGL